MNLNRLTFLYLLFFLLSGGFNRGWSQSCSIESDSVVCLSDFIGFKVKSSGGSITSYSWDLSDGKSSVQASPLVSYTVSGPKIIRVTVSFSNGSTCTATKSIYAHPLPNARFITLPKSNFCLSKNQVCLLDVSAPGNTGSTIVKRVIVFGDGYADISVTPGGQKEICHGYARSGQYEIVMEITDSKGCISRFKDTIEIIKDVKALYGYQKTGNCDTSRLCLENLTQTDTSRIKRFRWDFGNGYSDIVNWAGACFTYKDSGSFSPFLVIETKEGCVDTFRQNNLIVLDPIIFDIKKDKYSGCLGTSFSFQDDGPAKDEYQWIAKLAGGSFSREFSRNASGNITLSDFPGIYHVTLTAKKGTCKKTFLDSIEVFGPKASMSLLNSSVCHIGDTTYFCNTSDYTSTKGIRFIWDFNDSTCLPCTTDTRNGINIGVRCRYSKDEYTRHLYTIERCYRPSLFVEDTITGCFSRIETSVMIGPPDTSKIGFSYSNQNACTGESLDRVFNFMLRNYCGPYYINPDSAAAPGNFKPTLLQHLYPKLSNSSGYVTVGLILESGNTLGNCPGVTQNQGCHDTIWYHHWIHLIEEADPSFKVKVKPGCSPFEVSIFPSDTTDPHLIRSVIDWGDGMADTIDQDTQSLLASSFTHLYQKPGLYTISFVKVNKRGCVNTYNESIQLGHVPKINFNRSPCYGDCITFSDSTTYAGDSIPLWNNSYRRSLGTEMAWWDLGSGHFSDSSVQATRCFEDTGMIRIRYRSRDSIGCFDTLTEYFRLGGAIANIELSKSRILCSEIFQFLDSSVLSDPGTGEYIAGWVWDFGDGSNTSYLEDPYHYYSSFGEFEVRLVVGTNRNCLDTIIKKIQVEGPIPSFEIITDSIGCVPLTIELKNTSHRVNNWIWMMGDPDNTTISTTRDSNIRFTYTTPGVYYLYLYGADSVYNTSTGNNQFCSAVFPDTTVPGINAKKVIVYPYYPVDFIMPDTVCIKSTFPLVDASDPIYQQYRWSFSNGDKVISTNRVNTHQFGTTGSFTALYHPRYPVFGDQRACMDSITKNIEVIDVKAQFDIDWNRSKPLHLQFINQSTNANSYLWNFGHPASGNKNTSILTHPEHFYHPDQGEFKICLISTSKFGCSDEYCQTVSLEYNPRIFIPNIFTPGNADRVNDAFDIDIEGEETYSLKIVNRLGETVFVSETDGDGNDGINWNGLHYKTNQPCAAGVYFVIFDYQFYYTDPVRYTGTLTLIRE